MFRTKRAAGATGYRSLAVIGLLIASMSTLPAPANAALASPTDLNLCLDVSGGSTADGAKLLLYQCHGRRNQQWVNGSINLGLTPMVNVNSGKCLDVAGASNANGATVWQWRCNGGFNQKWSLQTFAVDTVRLVNALSGKCLDVDVQHGDRVQQWACHSGSNQRWYWTSGHLLHWAYNPV